MSVNPSYNRFSHFYIKALLVCLYNVKTAKLVEIFFVNPRKGSVKGNKFLSQLLRFSIPYIFAAQRSTTFDISYFFTGLVRPSCLKDRD